MFGTLMQGRRACCAAMLALGLCGARAAGRGEWVLGQSAPMGGPFAPIGQDFLNGALLAFDEINRRGGVHGKPIRLVTLDDGYNTAKAAANARALIEDRRVLCFFNHAGSATVLASLPIAAASGIAYVGPYTGHEDLYAGKWPQLFVTRASFAAEFDKILDYVATVGYRRIGFVYYGNKIGEEQRRDIDAGLRRRGGALHVSAGMPLQGTVQEASAHIAAQTPDAMILGLSGMDAVAFIRALALAGSRPVYFARSNVGSNVLAEKLGPLANGIVVSQIVPSPFKPNSPVVREYLRLLKQRDPNARPSFTELEAFLNARLMIVALERAGANATREGLLGVLAGLGRIDLGGHLLDFSDSRRIGSRYVELTMLRSDGTFAQ